jgi:hypothetical protein
MLLEGKNLNLYFPIGGTVSLAAHATDIVIDLTADTQETTTRNTLKGKTNDYKGKYSYTLSMDGITNFIDDANVSDFQDCILQGLKLDFIFTDYNQIEWTGTILVTNVNVSSAYNAMSLFKSTLLGDGELIKIVNNVPPPPIGLYVDIVDQLGNQLAMIQAPGTYSVLRFDTIDCGGAIQPNPLIIMQAN